MPVPTNVGPSVAIDEQLSAADCLALLSRVCFAHLAFVQDGHANVLPIRYSYLDGWVYFRADLSLRGVITRNPWLVLSITERESATRVTSVIARGGCYETHATGTAASDAAALRGIMELRDRTTRDREARPHVRRSLTVFRLHVDELRGVSASVPCPASGRPHETTDEA
jgi:nitroimidazol reductase NimA-like FMN-containing flavoprotein (pyridoxamine 5'-phosphate oxidase superfamily)